ncbi:MAG: hypothetical protein EOP01_00130 [Propionibacteriaceae bacterium]|nr:MAG: hypothetical protein EOP01_00130 [Propionibacteriaceae bacterium]
MTTLMDAQREAWAEELLDRLTPAMRALSIVFLLVVLGDQVARPSGALGVALTVLGWVLWGSSPSSSWPE